MLICFQYVAYRDMNKIYETGNTDSVAGENYKNNTSIAKASY